MTGRLNGFGAVREWVRRAEGDWRAHGTAYELVRVLTVPARRGLIRLRVDGAHHLPAEGPAIVVANHLSFFDSVLLMFSLPRPVAFIGKGVVFVAIGERIQNYVRAGPGKFPGDAEADAALFDSIKAHAKVEVFEFDEEINSPVFARVCAEKLLDFLAGERGSSNPPSSS